MKLKKVFTHLVGPACFFFTLYIFAHVVILSALSREQIPSPSGMLAMLLFFFVFSGVNWYLSEKKRPVLPSLLIHFCVMFSAFLLFFILIAGYTATPSQSLIISVVFIAIYFLIAVPVSIVISVLRKSEEKEKSYQGMIRKSK